MARCIALTACWLAMSFSGVWSSQGCGGKAQYPAHPPVCWKQEGSTASSLSSS